MLRVARWFSLLRRLWALKTLADVQLKPDNYQATITKYGWFLVPKTHVSDGWTLAELNKVLEKLPELKDQDDKAPLTFEDPRYEKVQEKIDEWADTVDLKKMPKVAVQTAKQKREAANQMLYIKQSLGHTQSRPKSGGADTRAKHERVTFTHAWNYFRSIKGSEFREKGEPNDLKKISKMWAQLSYNEKNVYREQYVELLKQGKEVFQGELVDRRVKEEFNQRKKEGIGKGKRRRKKSASE